jgi:hypothetical protein
VLMGDRPVIEAKARYYQRLLARDQDEAADIVDTYVSQDGRESVYDAVLLPALYYAKQDRDRGLLSEGDAQFVGQATREILDVLAHDAAGPSVQGLRGPFCGRPRRYPGPDPSVCPARDEADAVACAVCAVFDQRALRRLGAYRGLYLVKVSSCARARSRRPSRGRRWSAPGPSA